LAGLAFFLFTTQPDIYKAAIGIITGFAAGPPAILKLLSFLEGDKGGNGKKPE